MTLQDFSPAIDNAILGAARNFCGRLTPDWDNYYPIEDRIQTGYFACLLTHDYIMAARNPAGAAFIIASRAINKTYRDEFKHLQRTPVVADDGNPSSEVEAVGVAVHECSEEHRRFQLEWAVLGPKIQEARGLMAREHPEENRVLDMFYGWDSENWKMADKRLALGGITRRQVYELRDRAINRIRRFLGWGPLVKKSKPERRRGTPNLARSTYQLRPAETRR
jgi:hypothetical protein